MVVMREGAAARRAIGLVHPEIALREHSSSIRSRSPFVGCVVVSQSLSCRAMLPLSHTALQPHSFADPYHFLTPHPPRPWGAQVPQSEGEAVECCHRRRREAQQEPRAAQASRCRGVCVCVCRGAAEPPHQAAAQRDAATRQPAASSHVLPELHCCYATSAVPLENHLYQPAASSHVLSELL